MKDLRLYSNSSLSDYTACPRKFFFRYILEWRSTAASMPLIFGACWHRAMDVVWSNIHILTTELLAERAYDAFVAEWVANGMAHPKDLTMKDLEDLGARHPMHAYEMLVAYIHKRRMFMMEVELLDVEKPFAVPLDPEDDKLFYVGKIDKLVKMKGRKTGIEHKTTTSYRKSPALPFKTSFLESFSPNSQVDGYLFALHMYYPGEAGGVWVDGSLVHKTEEGFTFIPVEKQIQQLDLWLWETRSTVAALEGNVLAYEETDPAASYMAAFPRRTANCISFEATCPYIDMCRAWANPKGKPLPNGFKVEPWDPIEHLNRGRLEPLLEPKK